MKPKDYYRVQESSLLVAILCCINLVHTPPAYFFVIHLNNILPSTPTYSNWFPSMPHDFYLQFTLPPKDGCSEFSPIGRQNSTAVKCITSQKTANLTVTAMTT
jgi:hypothetical protein